MRLPVCGVALVLVLAVVSCSKENDRTEVVPPGFCQVQPECQPIADRQNTLQNELRQKLSAQGVHDEYLPCGKYETTKAPNGFWAVSRDTAGCPPTASQQDPYPDLNRAKHFKQ